MIEVFLSHEAVPSFAWIWLAGKMGLLWGLWGIWVSFTTFMRSPQIADFALKVAVGAAALAAVGESISRHAKWIADHPAGTGAIAAIMIAIIAIGYIKVQEFVTYR